VLAGQEPSDERVKRLRALSGVARACAAGDRAGLQTIVRRSAAQLDDLAPGGDPDLAQLGAAAQVAYRRELSPS